MRAIAPHLARAQSKGPVSCHRWYWQEQGRSPPTPLLFPGPSCLATAISASPISINTCIFVDKYRYVSHLEHDSQNISDRIYSYLPDMLL